jgi:hypothetical protein
MDCKTRVAVETLEQVGKEPGPAGKRGETIVEEALGCGTVVEALRFGREDPELDSYSTFVDCFEQQFCSLHLEYNLFQRQPVQQSLDSEVAVRLAML